MVTSLVCREERSFKDLIAILCWVSHTFDAEVFCLTSGDKSICRRF